MSKKKIFVIGFSTYYWSNDQITERVWGPGRREEEVQMYPSAWGPRKVTTPNRTKKYVMGKHGYEYEITESAPMLIHRELREVSDELHY